MKTVVLELRGKRAAVLSSDGIVRILPDKNYEVGQVLNLSLKELERLEKSGADVNIGRNSTKVIRFGSYIRRHAAAAAAVMIITVLGTGTGVAAAYYPVSTVSLGTDSSISYRLNIFDKVLSVKAEDDVSSETAEEIEKKVKGHKIEHALSETLDYMEEKGAISEENRSIEMDVRTMFRQETRLGDVVTESVDSWNNNHKELPSGLNLKWRNGRKGQPASQASPEEDTGRTFEGAKPGAADGSTDRPQDVGFSKDENRSGMQEGGFAADGNGKGIQNGDFSAGENRRDIQDGSSMQGREFPAGGNEDGMQGGDFPTVESGRDMQNGSIPAGGDFSAGGDGNGLQGGDFPAGGEGNSLQSGDFPAGGDDMQGRPEFGR